MQHCVMILLANPHHNQLPFLTKIVLTKSVAIKLSIRHSETSQAVLTTTIEHLWKTGGFTRKSQYSTYRTRGNFRSYGSYFTQLIYSTLGNMK